MNKNHFAILLAIVVGLWGSAFAYEKGDSLSIPIEDGLYIGSWIEKDGGKSIVKFEIRGDRVNAIYLNEKSIENQGNYIPFQSEAYALELFDLFVKELDEVRITKATSATDEAESLWILSFENRDSNKILPGDYIAKLPTETLKYRIANNRVVSLTVLDTEGNVKRVVNYPND